MRILLDECLPRKLGSLLEGHSVVTVQEAGWSSKENGELLQLAADKFDAILTVDQRFPGGGQARSTGIAIIVLRASINDLDSLRKLVPSLLKALQAVRPGQRIVLAE